VSEFPSPSTTTVLARNGNTQLAVATVSGPITMWAQAITVQYQAQDYANYFTQSSAAATTTVPNLPNTIGTSNTVQNVLESSISTQSTSHSTTNPSPARISSTTAATIAIGVGVVALFVAGLILWVCRSRRKREKKIDSPKLISERDSSWIMIHKPINPKPQELGGRLNSPIEMGMPSPRPRAELAS
jgi:C4-dicarboxylate-specific signal transduction histidine kinase